MLHFISIVSSSIIRVNMTYYDVTLGSASERAKVWGSVGKVGSFSPVLLRHVIGQVRYGRGRKGKRKRWKQSLVQRYAEDPAG